MARLYFSPKPSPSAAVAAAASSLYCTLTTRVLLFLLGLLPLSLAAFAFALQWRGGGFPGRCGTARSSASVNVLGRSPFPTFPYFGRWNFTHPSNRSPKVCIVTSTSAGLDQVLPWIFFHKVIGVSTFFMFVEGNAASPGVSSVLESIPGVEVIYRTKALEEHQANSRIWNETWLEEFFFKPCNYELFVKQALNMEMAVVMAREASMDWIIHLDTDELIHPDGTKEYSLQELLSELPSDIDTVVFPNHESSVERHDIKEPFSEVSLFKRSYERISESTYYSYFLEAAHGNHDYFLTYANGKSAARIQDHLRGNGAHGWYNYMKEPNELTLDEATVLHYSYAKFSDLTSRHSRCGCKPTKEDVKRCFMLDFDRDAFIIASNATEEEMLLWY